MAQSIIDTLKEEHKMVLSELAELSEKGTSNREQKYSTMKESLLPHLVGEEKVLYPRTREEPEMRDISLEGIEEHGSVKTLLSQLDSRQN